MPGNMVRFGRERTAPAQVGSMFWCSASIILVILLKTPAEQHSIALWVEAVQSCRRESVTVLKNKHINERNIRKQAQTKEPFSNLSHQHPDTEVRTSCKPQMKSPSSIYFLSWYLNLYCILS